MSREYWIALMTTFVFLFGSMGLALIGFNTPTTTDVFSCNADYCVETPCYLYVPWIVDDDEDGFSTNQHPGWSKGPCSCSVNNPDGSTLFYCAEFENHPIRSAAGVAEQKRWFVVSALFFISSIVLLAITSKLEDEGRNAARH
jgi:hypothetical protein